MLIRIHVLWGLIAIFTGCTHEPIPLPVLPDKFSDIQKQTLNPSCAYGACHDNSSAKSLLSLEADSSFNQLLYNHVIQADTPRSKFKALVVPFEPNSSYLLYKLTLSVSD